MIADNIRIEYCIMSDADYVAVEAPASPGRRPRRPMQERRRRRRPSLANRCRQVWTVSVSGETGHRLGATCLNSYKLSQSELPRHLSIT